MDPTPLFAKFHQWHKMDEAQKTAALELFADNYNGRSSVHIGLKECQALATCDKILQMLTEEK